MSHEWRNHSKLHGRFHPEYSDDIQVIVHDGGPRRTNNRPELAWVRVTGCDTDVFRGQLLNQPEQLSSISQGSNILFIMPDGGEHPLMVTEKYLSERPDWLIDPCNRCGLSELFDAPSELMRAIFPNTPDGAVMEAFTAFCGACGGIQLVRLNGIELDDNSAQPVTKRWWQIWR